LERGLLEERDEQTRSREWDILFRGVRIPNTEPDITIKAERPQCPKHLFTLSAMCNKTYPISIHSSSARWDERRVVAFSRPRVVRFATNHNHNHNYLAADSLFPPSFLLVSADETESKMGSRPIDICEDCRGFDAGGYFAVGGLSL